MVQSTLSLKIWTEVTIRLLGFLVHCASVWSNLRFNQDVTFDVYLSLVLYSARWVLQPWIKRPRWV